jgi:hypothetical protein
MRIASLQRTALLVALAAASSVSTAATVTYDLSEVLSSDRWQGVGRQASVIADGSKSGVHLDNALGEGVVWLKGVEFGDGVIEVVLRGRDDPQRSFVGVAFHGLDDTTYDAVYFRPFNFHNPDEARRVRAVQYIAQPDFPWQRLRAEHPGQYEKPVADAPPADAWFTARIEIAHPRIRVFVNDAKIPSLEVEALSDRKRGRIGIWVGDTSGGDFSALRLTPAKPGAKR